MLKNKPDAEDVTQEVLIRIWKNLGNFKISSGKAWIIKTTHNICIDYLRKRSIMNNKEMSFDSMNDDNNFANQSVGSIVYNFPDVLAAESIKKAIRKLPEKLRSVFVLYEIEGLKYKEISQALNVPINSVKVYLLRARKELQKQLKELNLEQVA